MRLSILLPLVGLMLAAMPGAIRAQESSIEVLPAPGDGTADAAAAEPAAPPPPPPCGTQPITIARMQWPSSELLAAVHARLLEQHFGCEVRVQQTDMAAAGSSMGAIGQPAVVPEMWPSRIATIWNAAIDTQKVRQAGSTYSETVFEGWFVPAYALERWPDITTIEGLKAHAAEFGQPGGGRASSPVRPTGPVRSSTGICCGPRGWRACSRSSSRPTASNSIPSSPRPSAGRSRSSFTTGSRTPSSRSSISGLSRWGHSTPRTSPASRASPVRCRYPATSPLTR